MVDGWRRWAMAIFPLAHRPTTDGGDRRGRPLMAKFATDSRDRRGRCEQLTRPTATDDHWARFSEGVGDSSADRFQGDVGDRWGRCGDLSDCATDRRGRPTRPTDGGDAWGKVGGGISRAAGAQPMPMAAGGQAGRGDAAKMPAPRQTMAGSDIEQAKAGMQAGCALWPSRQRAEETKSQNAA